MPCRIKKSKKSPWLNSPWSENKIQMYVATHSHRDGYLFHADGNGNFLHGATASKKKLMGSRAGWPDLVYVLDGRIVWIELKAKAGSVSEAQKRLHEAMKARGCEVHVVKAVDGPEAWEKIKGILDNEARP